METVRSLTVFLPAQSKNQHIHELAHQKRCSICSCYIKGPYLFLLTNPNDYKYVRTPLTLLLHLFVTYHVTFCVVPVLDWLHTQAIIGQGDIYSQENLLKCNSEGVLQKSRQICQQHTDSSSRQHQHSALSFTSNFSYSFRTKQLVLQWSSIQTPSSTTGCRDLKLNACEQFQNHIP